MSKVRSFIKKRTPKERLMRATSFVLIAPLSKLVARIFPNWRLGLASLIGILVGYPLLVGRIVDHSKLVMVLMKLGR